MVMDDSDSDGLEDNLDNMPEHLRPLQLRGEVILKKDNRAKNAELVAEAKARKADILAIETSPAASEMPVQLTPSEMSRMTDGPEELSCGQRWTGVQVCCSLFWALLLCVTLGIMVLRSLDNTGDSTHRLIADTMLRRLEANASGVLAPALAVVRAVAMGAHSSLLVNTDLDPLASLLAVAGPELALSPNVLQAQVIGLLPNKMARMVPGLLHEPHAEAHKRRPLLVDVPLAQCTTALDPLACFDLENTSGLVLHEAPSEGAALAWLGPIYMRKGNRLQKVAPDKWPLTIHLLAHVNLSKTFGQSAPPALILDVAVELTRVIEAARDQVPEGGGLHICTPDGVLLASSDWEAHRPPMPVNPLVIEVHPYIQRVWDLPLGYVNAIAPDVLLKRARSEIWVGKDLVVVRPVTLMPFYAGAATASAWALRAVTFVPREAAVKPIIGYTVYALLSSIVTGVLLLVGLAVCRGGCHLARTLDRSGDLVGDPLENDAWR